MAKIKLDLDKIVPDVTNPKIVAAEENLHKLLAKKIVKFKKTHKRDPTKAENGEMCGHAIKHIVQQLPGAGFRVVFLRKLGFDMDLLEDAVNLDQPDPDNPSPAE